jgi:TRAP-type mannitol/chloroaromatic compound transport system substrate-binding protein
MKRRDFLKAGGAGLASTAIAAPAIAQSMPELKWRLTSSFPKSLDTLYGGSEIFVKAVAEATDNKFQIQCFAAGEIVPGLQALDAASNGTVEMCNTAPYYYAGKDPTFSFGTAVPFGLNTRMQLAWQRFGGGMELMNELYKKFQVYGIPSGNTGAQMGGFFRKEINTVDDMRGIKMRIGGVVAGRVMAKLGVVPQQLAGGDIYPALEKGTIDAAEWVGPYDDEKLGFVKIAKYYYYPGWWEGGAQNANMINLDKWNALPPAYQSIIRSCSALQHEWELAKYDANNPEALKRLVSQGAQLRPFPPAVMEASLSAALELYREISADNALFKKAWDSTLAFRNDQYLWWQIAEYGYDTYLIRSRSRAS